MHDLFRKNAKHLKEKNVFYPFKELRLEVKDLAILDGKCVRVAVIGTRDIEPNTKYQVEAIVSHIASMRSETMEPLILSGLAIGTDAAAHNMALNCGIPTVGVMATGLDTIYPYKHKSLADRMKESPGSGVATTFPDSMAPLALNFIDRTKTIVLLSDIVIIPAAKEKGNAILAARLAADYGIPVFAVPGRPDDRCSMGCNMLIYEASAKPLYDLRHLDEAMESIIAKRRAL